MLSFFALIIALFEILLIFTCSQHCFSYTSNGILRIMNLPVLAVMVLGVAGNFGIIMRIILMIVVLFWIILEVLIKCEYFPLKEES
jgi:hypothetical protein